MLAQNSLPWTVQTVSGDARHTIGATESPLAGGDQVGIGSKITTAAGARVILARGAERMTMSPGSEIVIPAETGGMVTRILQNLGTLLLKVNNRPEQHFEVATPYLAAVVKGTTFTVSVDTNGSAVHVIEGLVQVDDVRSGQSGLVRPGQTGVVPSTPGGGLEISGNKAPVQETQVTATASDDSAPASDDAPASKAKPENAKSESQVAVSKKSAGKGTLKSGLKISKALGAAKIDIATLTGGFIVTDVGTGLNAGSEMEEKSVSGNPATTPAAELPEVANNDGGNGNGGNGGGGNGSGGVPASDTALATAAVPVNSGGNGNAGGNGSGNSGNGGSNSINPANAAAAAQAPVTGINGAAGQGSSGSVVAAAAPIGAAAAAPAVSAPAVSAPVVTAPVVSAPVVSAPVMSAPVVSAPAVSAPVVAAPVFTPPPVVAPVVSAPVVTAPVFTPPPVVAPVVSAPVVTAPVVTTPAVSASLF
ncbi:MAG: FecR family protein [Alphaproteobacteria bacterium]